MSGSVGASLANVAWQRQPALIVHVFLTKNLVATGINFKYILALDNGSTWSVRRNRRCLRDVRPVYDQGYQLPVEFGNISSALSLFRFSGESFTALGPGRQLP